MKKILLLIATILCTAVSAGNLSPISYFPANLIYVPMTRQAYDYTCGIAATQSVLGYFGDDYGESALYSGLKPTEKDVTPYNSIVNFLRKKGYHVEVIVGKQPGQGMTLPQLKNSIDNRKPVIVLIQAYRDIPNTPFQTDWDDGHFVVVIGYDKNNIYFMDPAFLGNYTYIPQQEFLIRWHDVDLQDKVWNLGLIVTKNGGKKYDPKKIYYLQ